MSKKLIYCITKFGLIFWFLFGNQLIVSAQTVVGVVYDKKTNIALPYANIAVEGKSKGTVSNSNGQFYLNLKDFEQDDTLICAYLGYKTQRIPVLTIDKELSIAMEESSVGILGVVILSNPLTVKEILALVLENKAVNYPSANVQELIFLRTQDETFKKKFDLKLNKSSIAYFNDKMFENVTKMIPEKGLYFSDWLYKSYHFNDRYKKQKIKGIQHSDNMDEQLDQMGKEIEQILNEKSGEGKYWKVRSGPFLSTKIDLDNNPHQQDSSSVKNDSLKALIDTVSNASNYDVIQSKLNEYIWNADYINKPNKFKYTLEGSIIMNGESAYIINFKADGRGLSGKIYISSLNYAILRLDFILPQDVKGEGIKLFGIEYRSLAEEGIIYFQPYKGTYRLKYMMISETVRLGVKRPLSFVQKKERFLFDKTIEAVDFDIQAVFVQKTTKEYLVSTIDALNYKQFSEVKSSKHIKATIVEQYNDPKIWEGYSVIEPTKEMREYRKLKMK